MNEVQRKILNDRITVEMSKCLQLGAGNCDFPVLKEDLMMLVEILVDRGHSVIIDQRKGRLYSVIAKVTPGINYHLPPIGWPDGSHQFTSEVNG